MPELLKDRTQDAPAEKRPPMVDADKPGNAAALLPMKNRTQNRVFIIVTVVLLIAALLPVFRIFAVPVVAAAAFSTLFYPWYRFFLKLLKNNRGLAALVCCISIFIGAIIPVYTIGYLVAKQAVHLFGEFQPQIRELLNDRNTGLINRIVPPRVVNALQGLDIDWRASLIDGLKIAASKLSAVINKTSAGFFLVFFNVFVIFFTMFYFLMDGRAMVNKAIYLCPLRREYSMMLLSRFTLISRALVKGTIIIGAIQGTLGAVTLLIFGVHYWLLWWIVMILLGCIPMLGAWVVLVPAGIIELATGHYVKGIGILLIQFLIISNIDNILKPRLVGQEARMHDLVVFFSIIGGVAAFGPLGVIVGPVIAALLVALMEIYSMEFKEYLHETGMLPAIREKDGLGGG